ncbi:MAG TPA: alcohol dehydrogenase catalytic domain-containing protein, partial [Thermoplasmata archaeon]|nr:alcohol dehydrogenase catalytic domain-containing protein [Thermoplasmata archaeon]
MRALTQRRYGSASVLALAEVEAPTPDATSVLVKVEAASVNALDWRTMQGKPFLIRFSNGLGRPKRAVRGVDLAGRVEQVRQGDSRFKVGDEVFGLGSGSFAEFAAADESELVHKPPSIPFVDAATLGVAAVTALQALRDHGRVRA